MFLRFASHVIDITLEKHKKNRNISIGKQVCEKMLNEGGMKDEIRMKKKEKKTKRLVAKN